MAAVSEFIDGRATAKGLGGISAIVIADSMSKPTSYQGKRITTMQLRYPRFVHAEFMTHRMFSRNASSSRAIPVAKMLEQVRNEPAMPVHWGANQPGMQARAELEGDALQSAGRLWIDAAGEAARIAEAMQKLGLHKQVANRILEPFQFINVIVTATEYDNFYELRDHADADPNIAELARCMRAAQSLSEPIKRSAYGSSDTWAGNAEDASKWHLPYVTDAERSRYLLPVLLALSAARCARVSYMKHDGTAPSVDEDIKLFNMLVGGVPLHASPIEHQAKAANYGTAVSNNFRGWHQFRQWYWPQLMNLKELA